MIQAVVFGNVTLDIICYPVDDVPRHDSMSFERATISPGGCGSNVAIGLCALGVPTALVARVAAGESYTVIEQAWRKVGLETRFVIVDESALPAVSVGLVDSAMQPRFVHTSGANARLSVEDIDIPRLANEGAGALHVAGFFVLPGLADGRLPQTLQAARRAGMTTSLDVVNSPRMENPQALWPCLPELDIFMCNAVEARRLTGLDATVEAARALRIRGAAAVIVKLGEAGCWLESDGYSGNIPGLSVAVVDTTGAGDAFAAGLIAARLSGAELVQACEAANRAGARMAQAFGTVGGWK